jgi:hypothetical protein
MVDPKRACQVGNRARVGELQVENSIAVLAGGHPLHSPRKERTCITDRPAETTPFYPDHHIRKKKECD